MDLAFKYAEKNSIVTEEDYPYTGTEGSCQLKDGYEGKALVSTYYDVPHDDTNAMKTALNKGPVSVAIEADQTAFGQYQGGILNVEDCGTNLDHGVLAVGYGKEGDQEYYIVKNSWGPGWGESGFIRLEIKDGKAACGIQYQASYPDVKENSYIF